MASVPATIRRGDRGAVVRQAQYLLVRNERLLSAHDVDGIFGPKTEQVVKEFQQSAGITVDGIVGPITWGKLLEHYALAPILRVGSTGPVVSRLQEILNLANLGSPLAVDGIFGPLTEAAVKAFQAAAEEGIGVDGIVGPQTWSVSMHAAGAILASVVGV